MMGGMSYQAYLDAIETRTGRTPRQIIEHAAEEGLDASTPAMTICTWLTSQYGIGHGHAMALAGVIRKGPTISDKHVGTDGPHRDESTELWLDGAATRPAASAS